MGIYLNPGNKGFYESILVGINYDKDKKEKGHSCKIERVTFSDDFML